MILGDEKYLKKINLQMYNHKYIILILYLYHIMESILTYYIDNIKIIYNVIMMILTPNALYLKPCTHFVFRCSVRVNKMFDALKDEL